MDDCIFCKIIDGKIPSATILENSELKVILDRFPGNEGHVLILPKKHYANIFEIEAETAGKLFQLAVLISRAMKASLGFENMNVVQNNGPVAGQTVNHFHLHLIPRYEGDSVDIKWKQLDLTDEQIESVRKTISNKL